MQLTNEIPYGLNIIGTVSAQHSLPQFVFLMWLQAYQENYNNYTFDTRLFPVRRW